MITPQSQVMVDGVQYSVLARWTPDPIAEPLVAARYAALGQRAMLSLRRGHGRLLYVGYESVAGTIPSVSRGIPQLA